MSFSRDVNNWCKKTAPEYLDKTVRTIVMEIGNRVVLRSPVGDASYWQNPPPPGYVGGAFRGGWQYGFNREPISDVETVDASGRVSIQRIESGVVASNPAGIHYIVNNKPYAEAIENGISRQAPQGVVGLTELEFPEIVRRAK